MVLEALINPLQAEKRPWVTFFWGMMYATAALFISLFLFRDYASMVMVSLTAMVSVPLIYGAIKLEEQKDMSGSEEAVLFKEHGKVLAFFMFMFIGYVIAFSFWFMVLPDKTIIHVFEAQINTVGAINSPATGNAINIGSTIGTIFFNNMKVLAFCILFAFFYGFGSVFILTWNASVLATVIGSILKESSGSYLLAPVVLLKYSLHGIPEIAAYFLAGLAGGIISIAVIRHDFGSERFKHVLVDSVDLTIFSVVLLFAAALIEVFISPYIM